MGEEQHSYGIRKATQHFPGRNLLVVPHKAGELVVSHPAFGGGNFDWNVALMGRTYAHSPEMPIISFRAPTTSESISVVAYELETREKRLLYDWIPVQAGLIVETNDGVFANPLDESGNVILDEKVLKRKLDNAEKIKVGRGDIYLGVDDFGFAEYASFQTGAQDCDTFAEGGLARVIEGTKAKFAQNLRSIASPRNYPHGVDVHLGDSTSRLIREVLILRSQNHFGQPDWLGILGDTLEGIGWAYGVLKMRKV